MSVIDIDSLRNWLGRQESRDDVISAAAVERLSVTLDYPETIAGPGEPLPQPWHWLFFLPGAAASDIDVDGHPRRGGFLPPVPLPRRMWAGSSIRFLAPLHVGDEITRTSVIEDIVHKQGGTGDLVFVKVLHRIRRGEVLAIEEHQDLVYREASRDNTPPPGKLPPADPHWSREVHPDPVLLFRYSALTFNGHRIHYDREYARDLEGYAGLVVQGPLTATLLLDLLRREMPGAEVGQFRFRGMRPLLDTAAFAIQGVCEGKTVRLWAVDAQGFMAMDAEVGLL